MLEWLQSDPMGFLTYMLYRMPAVLAAIVLHECAHGYAAYRAGDPTAKMMGRLSLNPLKHLDVFGTLCLFLFGFGWAKPVPVNPNNFRRGWKDDLVVSVAGVAVNFALFLVFTLLSVLVAKFLYVPELWKAGNAGFMLRFKEDGFFIQLLPKYAKELEPFLKNPWLLHVQRVILHCCMINLGLALFNLLPIPPLDGFHVVNDILLKGRLNIAGRWFQVFQVALIFVMLRTDFISNIVGKAIDWVQALVMNGILSVLGV